MTNQRSSDAWRAEHPPPEFADRVVGLWLREQQGASRSGGSPLSAEVRAEFRGEVHDVPVRRLSARRRVIAGGGVLALAAAAALVFLPARAPLAVLPDPSIDQRPIAPPLAAPRLSSEPLAASSPPEAPVLGSSAEPRTVGLPTSDTSEQVGSPPSVPDPSQPRSQADIASVVHSKSAGVRRRCWEAALAKANLPDPLQARVKLELRIAPSGRVESARATGAPELPTVAPCIAREGRAWVFRPAGDTTAVTVPFAFAVQ